MSSSNSAVRKEAAALQLIEPVRPALQVITNEAPLAARRKRPRASFQTRRIVIRDQGYRLFRVF